MSATEPAVATTCWSCGEPVQASAVACLWCGVPVNARQIPSVLPPTQTAAPAIQPGAALPQVPAPHQRPRTAQGSAIAGNPASVGRQVAAFTLDVVAVAVVAAAVGLLTSSAALGALAAVEMIVGLWVLEARTGLTAGNAALGLRTSRSDAAYSPGAGRSLIRLVITGAGFLAAVVGAWVIAASGLWDPSGRSRSLAARASGTVTVRPPVRTTAPGAGASPASTTGAVASRVPERVVTQSAPLRVVPDEAPRSAPMQASTAVAHPADAQAAAPVAPRQEPVSTRQSPPAASAPASAARVEPGASPSPVAPAAPVAPTPAPAPSAASAQRAAEPQSVPIAPTAAQAAPAAPAAPQHEGALLLVFDTGQRETITLPAHVNLGRQPDPHATGDTLVAVDDPDRTVSKTHARLEHDDGATWVTDLGSTNGTELLD
ncbi:MAG: FHA domain-containing protein, partial [Demequina sp.]|uniref:FHA domain-containing protein n=1 Tax=Demequina sp. TaxID=2050685 RepID=UPI003A89E0A1